MWVHLVETSITPLKQTSGAVRQFILAEQVGLTFAAAALPTRPIDPERRSYISYGYAFCEDMGCWPSLFAYVSLYDLQITRSIAVTVVIVDG
jgi:hypothetical protein